MKGPENEFKDAELSNRMQVLCEKLKQYLSLLAGSTVPCDESPGFFWLPKAPVGEVSESHLQAVESLHLLADEVVTAHEELVATAEEKLIKKKDRDKLPIRTRTRIFFKIFTKDLHSQFTPAI